MIESDSGMGRSDMKVWRPNDHRAVIQEYKSKKINGDFDETKSQQLTARSKEGLMQIQSKNYRGNFDKSDITEVHEYGIAFYGQYCSVVGRTMSRKTKHGTWSITKEYTGNEDEANRAPRYFPLVSSS